jgi:hypothetical protein
VTTIETVRLHEPFAGIVPPNSVADDPPAVPLPAPPHVLFALNGVVFIITDG